VEDVPEKTYTAYVVGARHIASNSDSEEALDDLRQNVRGPGGRRSMRKPMGVTVRSRAELRGLEQHYTGHSIPDAEMRTGSLYD